MFFKKKAKIPSRPWICGTPLAQAIQKKDKRAVKMALDYQYSEEFAIYDWDLKYKDLKEIEKDEIQKEIEKLKKFQKEIGFGPWYHENDIEEKINFN